MVSRIIGTLLGLAALILAVFCVARYSELRALRTEIARLRTSTTVVSAPAIEATAPTKTNRTATDSAVSRRSTTNTEAKPGIRAKKISIKKRTRNEMVEMMKNPKRKKFMEAAWTLKMDSVYGPLFRYYEMTPDELQYFQSLLMEKSFFAEDFAVRRMEADAQESADIRRQEEEAEAELNGRIREFLGNEAYQKYNDYEERLPNRMMMQEFKRSLLASGRPLTNGQEDELIRIMYDERQNFSPLRHLAQKGDGDALLESLPADRAMQKFDEGCARMTLRARQALTPVQFESFTNYINELRDTMEFDLAVQSAVKAANDTGSLPNDETRERK
jgi:hypothetical protein